MKLSGSAREDVDVELLQTRFNAERETVTAMLPGNRVVILVRVVVKLIGSVTRDSSPVLIVIVENGERRVDNSLQS